MGLIDQDQQTTGAAGTPVAPPAHHRAERGLALLTETSAHVGTTLDVATTADELARFVVDRYADYCTVLLLERHLSPDGDAGGPELAVRRLAVQLRDPARLAGVDEGLGQRIRLPAGHAYVDVVRSGRSMLVSRTDPAGLAQATADARAARVANLVGITSILVVPLRARQDIVGLVVLGRYGDSGPFDIADQLITEQVADRAALAVDNALLYHRERRTALTLQRSLLPRDHPPLPGVRVTHRYLPGIATTEVGGDWFDVIPLSGGRVALVVGDVMGRGLHAAAAMGQLRMAVRTLAVLDLLPEDILGHLDDVAQSLEAVQLATCIYAVWDPVAATVVYASAGHLPPLISAGDGPVKRGPLASGAPLGVGGVAFESVRLTLPRGGRIALFTDGLVESRGSDLDDGLTSLARAFGDASGDIGLVADELMSAMGRDVAHDDDVALLLADVDPLPPAAVTQWSIPSAEDAVSQARALTASVLAGWGLSRLAETGQLLASEVVTNALRYARRPIVLRWVLLGNAVVCEVSDDDTRLPRVRRAAAEDEGGRGLHLVSALADRWGSRPTESGKVVWFELAAAR